MEVSDTRVFRDGEKEGEEGKKKRREEEARLQQEGGREPEENREKSEYCEECKDKLARPR